MKRTVIAGVVSFLLGYAAGTQFGWPPTTGSSTPASLSGVVKREFVEIGFVGSSRGGLNLTVVKATDERSRTAFSLRVDPKDPARAPRDASLTAAQTSALARGVRRAQESLASARGKPNVQFHASSGDVEVVVGTEKDGTPGEAALLYIGSGEPHVLYANRVDDLAAFLSQAVAVMNGVNPKP